MQRRQRTLLGHKVCLLSIFAIVQQVDSPAALVWQGRVGGSQHHLLDDVQCLRVAGNQDPEAGRAAPCQPCCAQR